MAALAITDDVEAGLGRSLAAEEIPRANSLLVLASAHVEAETRYRFARGDYTISRTLPSVGRLRLPAGMGTTVAAVRTLDRYRGVLTVLTGWTVNRGTVYGLYRGFLRSDQAFATGQPRERLIEVDFTVVDPVPDEVIALVAGVVASTLSGPPVGAASEGAGPFQVSYVNSSGKVWLSASDKTILSRYRQPKSALDLT